jgi:GT2 family glycosyltransferase
VEVEASEVVFAADSAKIIGCIVGGCYKVGVKVCEFCTGCFFLIRSEILKKIGGFDKRYFMYFEDCDLSREVNRISKVIFNPLVTVYHEWHRESKSNMKLKLIHITSMLKYFAKWTFKK